MKIVQNRTLGFDVTINVPETEAEYLEISGGEPSLIRAVESTTYNVWNPAFRAAFVERLEEQSGIARKTKPILNKDGTPKLEADGVTPLTAFNESEADFLARVLEETSTTIESYQALANEVASGIAFDATRKVRTGNGPKLAKTYYINADLILTKDPTAAKATAILSEELGYAVLADRESLAKALKVREDRRRAEQVAGLL